MVPILFRKYEWFSSIGFQSYGLLHHKGNPKVFASITHSIEKGNKPISWEQPRKLLSILSESMGGSLPSNSHKLVHKGNKYIGFSYQYPIALEKATNSILREKPRKLVILLFPKYGWFYSIRFLSYEAFHNMENNWGSPSISHSIRECSKTHPAGRTWDIGTHTKISILWYALSQGNCFSISF